MSSFAIKHINESDLSAFWHVFKEVLTTEFPGYTKSSLDLFLNNYYSENSFRYYLTHHLKLVLVAEVNSTIVGFAVIDEPYGGVSLLRWLGVKRQYQKQGIGTQLIVEWLKIAKSMRSHKAEVAAQPEAKVFYEKAGLTLEGHRKKSYFGIDQYLFGKVLK